MAGSALAFSLGELVAAADLVHRTVAPTPAIRWPLLSARAGCQVWVKHENHTQLGAFKIRGGLVYVDRLMASGPPPAGLIAATRGNHGQSVPFAARRAGLRAVVVVPHGNSTEKNAAMRALGAELIEHGSDFQAALEFSRELARQQNLHPMPSMHPWLVLGVASYALELFEAAGHLDAVYVPIGLGSGICGTMAVRDALGLNTQVIGVVAERAPTYALSYAARKPVPTNDSDTIADGLAVRVPDPDAVDAVVKGAARIVTVSEGEIRAAMRVYHSDTHNTAEPAGAAALAALLKERAAMAGNRVAVILSGANVDAPLLAQVLAGDATAGAEH
jgi:threonine dehydratase